jgi:hypothetical protein
VSQSGRTCRKSDRRTHRADDAFDVELTRDEVRIRVRGRLVQTLTGADVEAVRAVLHDPDKLQKLVARKTGNSKR